MVTGVGVTTAVAGSTLRLLAGFFKRPVALFDQGMTGAGDWGGS